MLTFIFRRLLLAIPTLIFIAFVIFIVLELAPGLDANVHNGYLSTP